jgi:omega-6 fatty acid desaturase / acyl-lipid omega-6 desaturase (Delta-12 desaturase)
MLADIKRAIPPHCFQRSVVRSSSYLLRDIASAAVLLLAVAVIPTLPGPLRLVAWLAYWAARG